MKFIEHDVSGDGKKVRYLFALGKSEAVILYSLLDKAYRFMPRTLRTSTTQARIRNMLREIRGALPRMPENDHDEYNFPAP